MGLFVRIFARFAIIAGLAVVAGHLPPPEDALGQGRIAAEIATYQGSDHSEQLQKGAVREGTLTVYSAVPIDTVGAIATAFQRKTGIKVNLWRAPSEEVRDRVLVEARANRSFVDVVFCNLPALQALRSENLLQDVVSPATADLIPQAAPEHRQWAAAFVLLIAAAYNTHELRKDDLPATYRDLLQMKSRGAIGVEAADYDWFAAVCDDLGEFECSRLFREIGRRHGYSVRKGHGLLTNLVATGEMPLALTTYSTAVDMAKRKGSTVDWFSMKPTIGQPAAVTLTRRAPHPNAGALFYDFVINEGQAILHDQQFIVTSRKLTPAIDRDSIKVLNPETVVANGARWQQLFDSVFLVRGR
jgi:ABC-type Fe3+ transport system substrate-binding protein